VGKKMDQLTIAGGGARRGLLWKYLPDARALLAYSVHCHRLLLLLLLLLFLAGGDGGFKAYVCGGIIDDGSDEDDNHYHGIVEVTRDGWKKKK
jgi:hypothetical protein